MQIYERTTLDPKNYNKDRYITCPITGSKLLFQEPKRGSDDWYETRDSGYKYVSATDPNIGFKVSPFDPTKFWIDTERPFDNIPGFYDSNISREEHKLLFEEAKKISDSLKAFGKYDRLFILNDDDSWEEYIYVAHKKLPANSTLEEILKAIDDDNKEYERKKALYLGDPDKYGPFFFRISAQTVESKLVEVNPLPAPTGLLYYCEPIQK